jgi:hypothetical protein
MACPEAIQAVKAKEGMTGSGMCGCGVGQENRVKCLSIVMCMKL